LDLVALVEIAEGGADVFEFGVDVVGNFRQADDHGEDGDRGDEHQLRRHDKTGFVIHQAGVKCVHSGKLSGEVTG
jgi:hypothetical protein